MNTVKTPDGKSENYTYNKNSQITIINSLIEGTLSYDKSKLGTVSLECGIKESLSYNDAGLISGISYSSDTSRDSKINYSPAKGKGGGTQYFTTNTSDFTAIGK